MVNANLEIKDGCSLSRNTSEDATYFAPASRESDDILYEQVEKAQRAPFICGLINTVTDMAMLLNSKRQIIMVNDLFCRAVGLDRQVMIGMRPGEALSCKNASNGPGGCGTSQQCASCSAVLAILKSQKLNAQFTDRCVVNTQDSGVMNLYISASQFITEKESFTLFIAKKNK